MGKIDGAEVKTEKVAANPEESGTKFIEMNPCTVILGGPGAGKTTFLKYLALAYADVDVFKKAGLTRSYIPAYIHLPAMGKEDYDIFATISQPTENRTNPRAALFFKRLAESGNLVVLLDSLDEVPADNKQNIVSAILSFCQNFPKARVIVSCRTADYVQVFDRFVEVEIKKLSLIAVKSIVKEWFAKDLTRAEKLIAMLEVDRTVASLTETPLLLSLLCIQYKNDLALPKKKTELYRRCIDALLRDWDSSRNFRRDSQYSQLSDDRKEMLFEYIAGANVNGDISYEFSEPHLLSTLSDVIARYGLSANDAKGILIEIESHHGIIEKCSAETYQFSHGTMHEYFVARHLVATRKEMEVLKSHFDDDRWHNVISFMCAIINDPSPMLSFLVTQSSTKNFRNYPTFGKRLNHLLLLYRCMTMGVAICPTLRASICDHLVESQIHMIVRLREDNVTPFAARRPQGVRQSLVRYGDTRPRPTIDKLLLPHRSLMNEIFLSPLPDYVEKVLRDSSRLLIESGAARYTRIGALTCLLAPIADAKPQEFLDHMTTLSSDLLMQGNAEVVRQIVVESITVHQKVHPNLSFDSMH